MNSKSAHGVDLTLCSEDELKEVRDMYPLISESDVRLYATHIRLGRMRYMRRNDKSIIPFISVIPLILLTIIILTVIGG